MLQPRDFDIYKSDIFSFFADVWDKLRTIYVHRRESLLFWSRRRDDHTAVFQQLTRAHWFHLTSRSSSLLNDRRMLRTRANNLLLIYSFLLICFFNISERGFRLNTNRSCATNRQATRWLIAIKIGQGTTEIRGVFHTTSMIHTCLSRLKFLLAI